MAIANESAGDARLIDTQAAEDDADVSLRPKRLEQFIGQAQLRTNLRVFIEAAKQRQKPLITRCSQARLGSARPRLPRSSRPSSEWAFA